MSWRTVVITCQCKLDLKLGYVVVRSEDTKRILLDEVSVNIVENNAVAVTGCLLNELALFGITFSRNSSNAINAALNYGYALILSAVNREICACGYLTQLGLFHDNMFNEFNLSCDLMEPFRIVVDRFVFKRKFNIFESEQKHEMCKIFEQVFDVDGNKQYLCNAINFRLNNEKYSLEESIFNYMLNVRELDGDKIFVFLNLMSFIDEEQLEVFFKTIVDHRFNTLFLEPRAVNSHNLVNQIIIDEDFCVI